MKADDFKVRVPFWVRWLGQWRAWRKAVADRKAHAIYMATPKLVGIVNGETKWTDLGYSQITHVWHLYETPSGVRTVEFTKADKQSNGEQGHPMYRFVAEWKAGIRDGGMTSDGKFGFTKAKVG